MRWLAAEARRICLEAFRSLDPGRSVARHLARRGDALVLGDEQLTLDAVDQVLLVAVGKAALVMYRSAAEALKGIDLPIRAIVISNECDQRSEGGTVYLSGSHPLPDDTSAHAAHSVVALLGQATPRTVVVFLISGGASAMLELPLDADISIADMTGFHRALVSSGMPIDQMNVMRKHLSAVKGGRLAAVAGTALRQYTLLISDVPGDRPDLIGSGPSLPDPSTWDDCLGLLSELEKRFEVPQSVLAFFRNSQPIETPKESDALFRNVRWKVLSSSADLAESAASLAREAGFEVVIDNSCDNWEYREAAVYLLERAKRLSANCRACCVISVGEVTVLLPVRVGEGGRNQQFALWCARELDRMKWSATVLSAGSDGIDGKSRAAGAVCDGATAREAMQSGMDVEKALINFDSSPLLRRLGADIVTGPTGNNLCDLRMVLRAPSAN